MHFDQEAMTIVEMLWGYGLFALAWLLNEITK